MKATVMESRNGKAVILTEDGMFREVKGNYDVGWEFDFKEPGRYNRKMTSRIAAIAACLMMAVSMGAYSYQNLMVYATVTLNGTAPIQLELNRHDKVIGVKAIDESGEALAEQLLDSGIHGMKFQDAVAQAEQVMLANENGKKKALLPQIQCKSSDKLQALTNMLKQEEATASQEAASTTEAGTAAAATTSEKASDVSAQDSGNANQDTTEASSGTEPSSSEEMTPQEEETQGELATQEETVEMSADEATDVPVMSADEAPADEPATDEPAADEAPADESADQIEE